MRPTTDAEFETGRRFPYVPPAAEYLPEPEPGAGDEQAAARVRADTEARRAGDHWANAATTKRTPHGLKDWAWVGLRWLT